MVLTAYVALSPVTGLFCHRRLRIKFCLSPVGPTPLRKLDTSVGVSGPRDFAVRCNISRQHAVDRSQAFRQPALRSHRAQNAAASTATNPAFLTIMIRPSCGVGWRELVEMICPTGEAKYFYKGGRQPCQKAARRANHHTAARVNSARVPDAVQRSSRCSAEPGPIVTVAGWTPIGIGGSLATPPL